jgi:hypothetical protein
MYCGQLPNACSISTTRISPAAVSVPFSRTRRRAANSIAVIPTF